MWKMHCLALCLLVTLLYVGAGTAEAESVVKRSDDLSCEGRQFELDNCITDGNVDFSNLHRSSYTPHMCGEMEPAVNCVKGHRERCPDLGAFQGVSGQAVDTFLSSFTRLCQEAEGGGEGEGRPQKCEGGKGKFQKRLSKCHKHIAVNIQERKMCKPLKKVISCMEKQMGKFQACSWMTESVKNQVQLGQDYLAALSAVKYNCQA